MRPSSAPAMLSARVIPGCWVMPSTAASASGTAPGSVTEASSISHTPSTKSVGSVGHLQREPRLADPADSDQRGHAMCLQRQAQLGDVPVRDRTAWWVGGAGSPAWDRRSCSAGNPLAHPARCPDLKKSRPAWQCRGAGASPGR